MRIKNLMDNIERFVDSQTCGEVRVMNWEYQEFPLNMYQTGSGKLSIDFDVNTSAWLRQPNRNRIAYESCGIKKVIFNSPATIVFWNDGTKTVVKCSKDDEYNPTAGLALCYMKKQLGNDNSYHKLLNKFVKCDIQPVKKKSRKGGTK